MSYRFVDSLQAGPGWSSKFILSWNSKCFGQFLCPSSAVYSLYNQQWYMSYRFVDSFRAGAYAIWHIPLLSVQWINSWWRTEELPETCRISCQIKFVKLMHLVGFIIKKFVTMQRGHVNVKLAVGICFFKKIGPMILWPLTAPASHVKET
jgi:hypothetical protein